MATLNWSSSYKRAFKKAVKNNPAIKDQILNTMSLLQENPFNPKLKSHKLKGILEGAWACSINYEMRIIFKYVIKPVSDETEILLIDLGSHDEVY